MSWHRAGLECTTYISEIGFVVGTDEIPKNRIFNITGGSSTKEYNYATGRDSEGQQVGGRDNWIQTGTTLISVEITITIEGVAPEFVDPAKKNVQLRQGRPLIEQGELATGSTLSFSRK